MNKHDVLARIMVSELISILTQDDALNLENLEVENFDILNEIVEENLYRWFPIDEERVVLDPVGPIGLSDVSREEIETAIRQVKG